MSIEIKLPENLTIHHISNHFAEMKEKAEQAQSQITLDASSLDSFDSSGLQMLLVLIKNAQEKDISINWENITDKLTQGANSLGLQQELKLS